MTRGMDYNRGEGLEPELYKMCYEKGGSHGDAVLGVPSGAT